MSTQEQTEAFKRHRESLLDALRFELGQLDAIIIDQKVRMLAHKGGPAIPFSIQPERTGENGYLRNSGRARLIFCDPYYAQRYNRVLTHASVSKAAKAIVDVLNTLPK